MKNNMTIGEIVANDFRTASVFRAAGIDFCCGGKQTIDEAWSKSTFDRNKLIDDLEKIGSSSFGTYQNFIDWELGFLCDYIVNTHHKYVMKTLPELVSYTEKIASVHANGHPELIEVADMISRINIELTEHLNREEKVVFPLIKEIFNNGSVNTGNKLISEIAVLSGDHESAGGAMDRIKLLTSGYKVPADGCNTYKVALNLLNTFEDDLHIHVHLENNILFPKALKSIN